DRQERVASSDDFAEPRCESNGQHFIDVDAGRLSNQSQRGEYVDEPSVQAEGLKNRYSRRTFRSRWSEVQRGHVHHQGRRQYWKFEKGAVWTRRRFGTESSRGR